MLLDLAPLVPEKGGMDLLVKMCPYSIHTEYGVASGQSKYILRSTGRGWFQSPRRK
ncbi:hypothetical protein BDV59DRAFT_188775 [Aspergillus ambiguus]|uniref:uncharacterized protein n=1 Tax=Aspergillus ambiguus TaxID=176160 RepID=UPI003CCD5609